MTSDLVSRAGLLARRWPTLLAIALAIVFPFVLPKSSWTAPLGLISGVLAYPISGAIRSQLRGRRVLLTQGVAFAGFIALALGSLLLNQDLGRVLLAVVWLGHAAWDFAHYRADRIVPRWLSEFCAVLDVLTAASLILLPQVLG
jgi:uncharacterized membrane protein YccC